MPFDLNGQPPAQEGDQQQQRQPEQQPQQPPVQQQPDEDYKRFEAYMRSYLGADPAALRQALQQNQMNTVELEKQRLKNEWGDQYEENFASVQAELQEMAKVNPQRAQSLANAEGAILIQRAKAFEQMRQGNGGNFQQGGINRSTTPATPGKTNFQYTASQIREMSDADRRANHASIMQAYSMNLVDRNA